MDDQPPTRLRVLAKQKHWQTYRVFSAMFANAANALAKRDGDPALAGLGVSQRQYERWFAGTLRTRPYPDQCRVLEEMFGIGIDQLLSRAPLQSSDVGHPAPATGPDIPVPGDPGTMERQIEMAARRALRFAATAEGSAVGPEMLEHVQEEVTRLALAYPRLPLSVILSDLVDVQDLAFRLLESNGHVRPTDARDLYLHAAVASGMLAKASHDLGDPRAALMQARTAYVCAENADHRAMCTWVRGLQSLITYWDGRTQDAVSYAQLGTSLATGVNGTARVWLASLEARAQAALGDRAAAEDAVNRADQARESVVVDDLDGMGGILTFPRVRQLYYAAEAAVMLPQVADNAVALAQEASAAYRSAAPEDWAFGDQAGADTDLALARIAGNDLEGAAEAVRPVLDLSVEQRNHGIVLSARRVHSALRSLSNSQAQEARDMREEIEDFTGLTAAAVVRR